MLKRQILSVGMAWVHLAVLSYPWALARAEAFQTASFPGAYGSASAPPTSYNPHPLFYPYEESLGLSLYLDFDRNLKEGGIIPDLNGDPWFFKTLSLSKESHNRLESFQAEVQTSQKIPLVLNLDGLNYKGNNKVPDRFTQTWLDADNNPVLTKKRWAQKSEINPNFQAFQNLKQQDPRSSELKDAHVTHLDSPLPTFVRSFKERWTSGEGPALDFEINNLTYEQYRWISGYDGVLHQGAEEIPFSVKALYDFKGGLKEVNIRLEKEGFPVVEAGWSAEGYVSNEATFDLFRQNSPVPLLMGPRTQLRLNGQSIPDVALLTGDDKSIQTQLPPLGQLQKLRGKEEAGLNYKVSGPQSDLPSSFSLKNMVRNVWYFLTGRMTQVRGIREALHEARQSDPGKFSLAVGFRDPSFMSLADLQKAYDNYQSDTLVLGPQWEEGEFVNDQGHRSYRFSNGDTLDLVDMEDRFERVDNELLVSLQGIQGDAKVLAQDGDQAFEQLTKQFNEILGVRADKPKTWWQKITHFFGLSTKESPKRKIDTPLTDPLQRIQESTAQFFANRTLQIKKELDLARQEFDQGDFRNARDRLSLAMEEAMDLNEMQNLAMEAFLDLREGMDSLNEGGQYALPFMEGNLPDKLTPEDFALAFNPSFFKGDKDFIKNGEIIMEGGQKARAALMTLAQSGVVDFAEFNALGAQIDKSQTAGIKGLADLQRRNGVVVAGAEAAEFTDDFLGGLVLGSAIPTEKVTPGVLVGQAFSYIPPFFLFSSIRDGLIGFVRDPKETFKGMVKGDYLTADEITIPAIRGHMIGGVVLSVPTSTRDGYKSGKMMLESRFKEGKLDTAFNVLGILPGVKSFKALKGMKFTKKLSQLDNYVLLKVHTKHLNKTFHHLVKIGKTQEAAVLRSIMVKNYKQLRKMSHTIKADTRAGKYALEKPSYDLLKAKMDILNPNRQARPPTAIKHLVDTNAGPPKILARVIVGDSINNRHTLSKSRPNLFIFDPEEVSIKDPDLLLKKIGYSQNQIKVSKEKPLYVALFENKKGEFVVERPTWEKVKELALKDKNFIDELAQADPEKFGAGVMPRKVILEMDMNNIQNQKIRDLFNKKFGLNNLFSGNGHTTDFSGKMGVREWWIRDPKNLNLEKIDWSKKQFKNFNFN